MKNWTAVAIAFGLLLVLLGQQLLVTSAESVNPVTVLLSQRGATEGGLSISNEPVYVTTSGSSAHALWTEDSGTGAGYALFYRRLPFGQTQKIAGHTWPYFYTYPAIESASSVDGSICFIWTRDVGGAEKTNLFFWRPGQQTATELTDNDASAGSVGSMQVVFDNRNRAHASWIEAAGFSELFYWSEAAGVTRMLSDPTLPAGSVYAMETAVEDSAVHVIWAEWTGGDTAHDVFYWDSGSDAVRHLSLPNDASIGVPIDLQLVVDSAGGAHVFWIEEVQAGQEQTNCPFHWDSDGTQIENLAEVQEGRSASGLEATLDGLGRVHAAWIGKSKDDSSHENAYYWSTGMVTPTIVVTDVNFTSCPPFHLSASDAGKAHLAWAGYSGTSTAEEGDVYYWDSVSQEIHDVSDAVVTQGNVAENPGWRQDASGNLHIAWFEWIDDTEEYDAFYWNSDTDSTLRLSNPITATGNAPGTLDLEVDGNDTAHVLWKEGSQAAGTPALFYWDGATQALREIGGDADQYQMLVDADAVAHVAWSQDSETAEGYDVYYWDDAGGFADLSDAAATEGGVLDMSLSLVLDATDRLYLVWGEDSGMGEGIDVFGAWEPIVLDQKVYLPLVARR